MSICILQPDPDHCRPFFIAQQLETAAWGLGETETEARARMTELRRNGRLVYRPELEIEAHYQEGVHSESNQTNP